MRDWSSDVCSSDLRSPRPSPASRSWRAQAKTPTRWTADPPADRRLVGAASAASFRSESRGNEGNEGNGTTGCMSVELHRDNVLQIGRAACRERVCQYV